MELVARLPLPFNDMQYKISIIDFQTSGIDENHFARCHPSKILDFRYFVIAGGSTEIAARTALSHSLGDRALRTAPAAPRPTAVRRLRPDRTTCRRHSFGTRLEPKAAESRCLPLCASLPATFTLATPCTSPLFATLRPSPLSVHFYPLPYPVHRHWRPLP